jgi:phosphoglycerate dehydrogenase-like enzyme
MDVVGWNRSGHDSIHVLPLDELLATADVIQLCIALTPDTESMLGATEFAAMRPGTIVVNTARGGLVDHSALASSHERGQLGGYAADVWTPEPPSSDDRLQATGRATVTPHVAAMADVTYREICVRPANSIAAMLGGGVPEPSTVYRGHG